MPRVKCENWLHLLRTATIPELLDHVIELLWDIRDAALDEDVEEVVEAIIGEARERRDVLNDIGRR